MPISPEDRLRWSIPETAQLVEVAGEPCEVSLSDEYDPPKESGRRAAFAEQIAKLEAAARQEIIDSRGLRF